MSNVNRNPVAVQADTGSVLNLLRHTFTNSTTFVNELLQNARRAGATEIVVDISETSVVFTDDGCGIDDPAVLLSIAKSGWEEAIQKEEAPYGAGFLAALFACETINVRSKDYSMTALTSDLIALKPAEVVSGYQDLGKTSIALINTKKGVFEIRDAVFKAASGFPVRIVVNTPMHTDYVPESRNAMDSTWTDIGPGFVKLAALIKAEGHIGTMYLQGLEIGKATRFCRGGAPIHLKSTLFRGRMPDRDVLINEDDAREKINQAGIRALQGAFEREFNEATTQDLKADWAYHWFDKCERLLDRSLLSSLGYLPIKWFLEWDGSSAITPGNLDQDQYEWKESIKPKSSPPTVPIKYEGHFISFEELKERGVYETEDDCEYNLSALFVAMKGGLFLTYTSERKSIVEPGIGTIKTVTEGAVTVETEGEVSTAEITGKFLRRTLTKAEKLILVHDEFGSVEVQEGLAAASGNEIAFTGETNSWVIARSADSYINEDDRFDEDDLDQAVADVDDALALLVSSGPATHLVNALKKMSWNASDAAKGRTFTVTFNDIGVFTVVEA